MPILLTKWAATSGQGWGLFIYIASQSILATVSHSVHIIWISKPVDKFEFPRVAIYCYSLSLHSITSLYFKLRSVQAFLCSNYNVWFGFGDRCPFLPLASQVPIGYICGEMLLVLCPCHLYWVGASNLSCLLTMHSCSFFWNFPLH